ncbi:MAG TPA: hypothetical protein VMV41_00100 [Cellulomonadaceae bacterium]|nr:hypothetical protein [Cellulomonadaceae bacterium]
MTGHVSADTALTVFVSVAIFLGGALWKLATMLAEIRGQVRHNGGSTLKDDARTAAEEAVAARQLAENVKNDLQTFREHQAEDGATNTKLLARVQHDVTNIRAGQEMLLQQQLRTDQRVTDHRDRNEKTIAALHQAVAKIGNDGASRDKALGDALHESLDVALAVEDAAPTSSDNPPDSRPRR